VISGFPPVTKITGSCAESGGTGTPPVQPGGDARLSINKLGSTAVTITHSRICGARIPYLFSLCASALRESPMWRAASARAPFVERSVLNTFTTGSECAPHLPLEALSSAPLGPSLRKRDYSRSAPTSKKGRSSFHARPDPYKGLFWRPYSTTHCRMCRRSESDASASSSTSPS
jgi:hypothetical protein